jgi:hypothetical protein
MNRRLYVGIFVFLMSMALLTVRAHPMSVEDYAKTASRTAVMANVCPRFFKVNIEQMRQWRRIAIEVGEQLSQEFDAILKAEIKRRNAEVDRAGHRVWCIQMRGQYESQGVDIEAPTRPYEEEAKSAAERMKAEAEAKAKAQVERQAEAEPAAKEKLLPPREARKHILPPVKFDKPPSASAQEPMFSPPPPASMWRQPVLSSASKGYLPPAKYDHLYTGILITRVVDSKKELHDLC